MPLIVNVAHFSATGPRVRNEDFTGCVTPHGADLASKGFAAVVADGVSGAGGGREAAEHCARNVLADYYATPDTWEVSQSLDKIYSALNRWVQMQARASPDLVGMATTLTTLVLRGSMYHFAHVGDTRIYLLRDGTLQRLTTDHVWQRPEMEHVLTRAVGLDTSVTADHGFGLTRAGDVFALVSDGVWAALAAEDFRRELTHAATRKASLEHIARTIVEYAHQLGGKDNATALIVRVEDVDANALRDVVRTASELPALPPMEVGQVVDGFTVLERMHLSRVTVLYRVRDGHGATGENGRELVMKALTRDAHSDAHERLAFAHERWINKRVVARFFAQNVDPPENASASYSLSTFHTGKTLAQQLATDGYFSIPEAITCAVDLLRAVGALHRRSIIHRDIKPENIHLGDDGQLRVLDLGVAASGFEVAELSHATRAGTPSYLAPELFQNVEASLQSDIYAVAVTLYQLLSRKFPYGEIEPFQTPKFGEATPVSRWRPDCPGWFENIISRGLAVDLAQRFETAEEFLLAVEQGPLSAASPRRNILRQPLATRNRLRTWQVLATASIILNFVLAYFLNR
ncbi:MAG: bifunctional protein-serine/threonine kinase/phosphatase [Rhizobacter sp.]|nr:bifunctional protein-serine/threonine kinase/phosphatase [Burkholderiales bacterium]